MKTIYYAAWGPILAKLTVEEKPKTYQIISEEKLIGITLIGKRIDKGDRNLFETADQALEYLIQTGTVSIKRLRERLEDDEADLAKIKELRDALRDSALPVAPVKRDGIGWK